MGIYLTAVFHEIADFVETMSDIQTQGEISAHENSLISRFLTVVTLFLVGILVIRIGTGQHPAELGAKGSAAESAIQEALHLSRPTPDVQTEASGQRDADWTNTMTATKQSSRASEGEDSTNAIPPVDQSSRGLPDKSSPSPLNSRHKSPGSDRSIAQFSTHGLRLWVIVVFANSRKEDIAVHVNGLEHDFDSGLLVELRKQYYLLSSRWSRFFQLRAVRQIQCARVS